MVRLFLAVPLPNQVKKQIEPEIKRVKGSLSDWNVNWVAPENLHITLVFFGWVNEEQVETIKAGTLAAVSGFSPFEITTGKLSLEGRPLWLEIEQGKEKFKSITETLFKKLTIKGSLEEERGFHAHLTLGRVKQRGKSVMPVVRDSYAWKAKRAVLYESTYKGGKRIYTETTSFPFSA